MLVVAWLLFVKSVETGMCHKIWKLSNQTLVLIIERYLRSCAEIRHSYLDCFKRYPS